jgi:hypothetical protein
MLYESRHGRRAIAVLLIISLSQIYVLANARTTTTIATSAPNASVFGRLNLSGNKLILVNGNEANTGMTIFSGAQLQTPEAVEATVQLGPAGHLDIAANSSLTLKFDGSSVDVYVAAGSALLSTNAGFTGTITTADGKVERSDPAIASVIGGVPVGVAGRAAAKLSKEEKAAFIIIPITIAAIIILVAASNDSDNDNVSPGGTLNTQ